MKIGIDIGGSHIAVGIVNKEGKILEKIEQDIKEIDKTKEYIVDYVDNAIAKLSKNGVVEHIGIAAPGNPKGTKITNLVNLGMDEIDFKQIEEKYNVKIKSINDGKAAAIAEKEYGSMKGYKDCAFLCLGTGIGGGIFLNNTLLQSNRNPGFELGHMVIDRNGIECNCGKKGCFETYCSIKRLKEKILHELIKKNKGIKLDNGEELIEHIKLNLQDTEIKNLLEEYTNNLIIGLSNVIDIFEPEIISLGGSFVYFEDIIYKPLLEKMNERRYVFNKESLPKIVLANFKNDAGLIGATLI